MIRALRSPHYPPGWKDERWIYYTPPHLKELYEKTP